MSGNSEAPVIIKKIKKGGGGGHHGGAWKVAYADFVTAMMAFFMLMWLLNATTEKQRKGIADYFNPTIPINRVSGGGDGSFGGESIYTEETLSQNGVGASMLEVTSKNKAEGSSGTSESDKGDEQKQLEEIEQALAARAGESLLGDDLLQHIVTKVTDEGLIVELFDLPGEPLFAEGSFEHTKILTEILAIVSEMFRPFENRVAVNGYVRSYPLVLVKDPTWDLAHGRADSVRLAFSEIGFDVGRIERVTGYANRKPVTFDPMSVRNNRLEIILLRQNP